MGGKVLEISGLPAEALAKAGDGFNVKVWKNLHGFTNFQPTGLPVGIKQE